VASDAGRSCAEWAVESAFRERNAEISPFAQTADVRGQRTSGKVQKRACRPTPRVALMKSSALIERESFGETAYGDRISPAMCRRLLTSEKKNALKGA